MADTVFPTPTANSHAPGHTSAHAAVHSARSRASLDANIIIANAPDPVFVSDLEGKILLANDAVTQLLGFRTDEVLEQSLSRFISPEETRAFLDALREVVEREESSGADGGVDEADAAAFRTNQGGVTRNVRLNPRSASGGVIPTTLNASALRDADGKVIGAIGILRDMRAYEQVVRDLQESKAELREASRAKDVFLSIASHELKTPLTTIKALAQMTRRRLEQSRTPDASYLDRMERAIRRMEMLVNDLVDVSRIQAGKLTLRMERADLAALARQAAHEQATLSERTILVDIPDAPVAVEMDTERVWQVLTNLLTNALKYSPKETPVAVTLSGSSEEAVICVRDQGDGIPPDELAHVFERFYRGQDARIWNGSAVGLGLGLFISRELVERHGGRIWVESAIDGGSTFYVALPRPVVAEPALPTTLSSSLADVAGLQDLSS